MNKPTSLVRILAAILSGLLLAAAFPKWDQTYLLIFALVPLLSALRDQSLKAAFWLGLVSGLAHYVALLYWIVYVTHVFGKLPLIAAIGILLLLAGYLCLYTAVWGLGVAWGAARGLSLLWWAPVLWVALEMGQTYIISGFPWELLGNGLYQYPLLLQLADITGVYGLSFLVVLVNVSPLSPLLAAPGEGLKFRQAAAVCLILALLDRLRLLSSGGSGPADGRQPQDQGGGGPGQPQAGGEMAEEHGPDHPEALRGTD